MFIFGMLLAVTYFYLLFAGILISAVHFYLVWHHRDNRKYSLSEHAIIDKNSQLLYIFSHIVCEIFFLLFSYRFYVVEHNLKIGLYLNISFAIFDFIQAILPSRDKTEKIHYVAAYLSWLSYLVAGVLALIKLRVSQPFATISYILLIPILGMFFYMHIKRTKLYPFQIAIVPLFIIYMFFIVIGSNAAR